MNRYIIIFAALILVVIVVIGAVFLLRPSNNTTPVIQQGTQGSYQPTSSTVSVSAGQSKEAAKAAYQKALSASGDPDNIKPGATVVVDIYALQTWTGNHTGGEALLKFDTSQNKWIIVDPGGGAWSIDGLVAAGVPRDTATALLAPLR